MPTDAPPPGPDEKCEKCGEVAEFISFIPRFGQRPAYRIFECGSCKALAWIAEKIGE